MWYTCVNYVRFVLSFAIVIHNSNYDNYNASYLTHLLKFDLFQPELCFRDSWNWAAKANPLLQDTSMIVGTSF